MVTVLSAWSAYVLDALIFTFAFNKTRFFFLPHSDAQQRIYDDFCVSLFAKIKINKNIWHFAEFIKIKISFDIAICIWFLVEIIANFFETASIDHCDKCK